MPLSWPPGDISALKIWILVPKVAFVFLSSLSLFQTKFLSSTTISSSLPSIEALATLPRYVKYTFQGQGLFHIPAVIPTSLWISLPTICFSWLRKNMSSRKPSYLYCSVLFILTLFVFLMPLNWVWLIFTIFLVFYQWTLLFCFSIWRE